MDSREGKVEIKRVCDTPYLSCALSSTELSLCHSQDDCHTGCAAPAYVGPAWLVETVMI